MLVKVCGMRDSENIAAVDALGIDIIGFIFYPRSPRYVADSELPSTACQRAGVFVDATYEQITAAAARHALTHIQLHGNETTELCRRLRDEGYRVIKAISVATTEDITRAEEYQNEVDFLLFDTKCSGHGGSGRQFDWSVLDSYRGTTPFILSGGITPQSVEAIKNFTHPRLAGIDLNSGFEASAAIKNITQLEQFLKQIR